MVELLQRWISQPPLLAGKRLREEAAHHPLEAYKPTEVQAEICAVVLLRVEGDGTVQDEEEARIVTISVPHGKPYAGNLHVRFDEGAGVPDEGRSALLYSRRFCVDPSVARLVAGRLAVVVAGKIKHCQCSDGVVMGS